MGGTGYHGSVELLAAIRKTSSQQLRVVKKMYKASSGSEPAEPYFDIREWWFKDGSEMDPIPTKRGIMVHRKNALSLVLALVKNLTPADLTDDAMKALAQELFEEADRLSSEGG
jgi:hypothetical protein